MIDSVLGDKYRILRLLGAGGMGSVYEALDTGTGERVAIKVVTAETARNEGLMGRFEREAQAAAALSTPHIVAVLAFGRDAATGLPFMAMECLEGEDLHQLLKRLGPLPWELALRLGAQACLGLGKAHEHQIVHRDIKPANLFLASGEGGQRTLKLLDFGIAKIKLDLSAAGNDPSNLTRTGAMLGSPLYMAPEQARGQKDIDARADLWSLGVVLYKTLCGRTPHQDTEALGELIITICTEPPAPVQQHAPWVPAEVAAVIDRALRLDPAERFQSAAAMLEAIKALLPRGWVIDASMLRPLEDTDRAPATRFSPALPPKPAVSEPGGGPASLEAFGTTVGGPGSTTSGGPGSTYAERRGGRSTALVAGALGMLLVGGGAAYALRGSPPPASTLAPATQPSIAAPPKQTRVSLVIIPSSASVEVEGVKVTATDGLIELSGAPGSVHRVRVSSGESEITREVVITESGAMPAKIELSAPASASSASSAGAGAKISSPANPGKAPPKSTGAAGDIRIRR